ncbi:hypothetical protein [Nocardioides sp. Root151]|uniref:hypothetical protein n=1 Tax=Nocardioides sp. Root151 TaxID=1736475 RepID=UPI000A5B88A6|nr:hypothetical protein [Nocardioides sp. Root151]
MPRLKPGASMTRRAIVVVPLSAKTKAVTVTLDANSGTVRWVRQLREVRSFTG